MASPPSLEDDAADAGLRIVVCSDFTLTSINGEGVGVAFPLVADLGDRNQFNRLPLKTNRDERLIWDNGS